MARRSDVLELAVLGLLHESPMHGYELRKRLNAGSAPSATLSLGTLYPCLKTMVTKGWIAELGTSSPSEVAASPLSRPARPDRLRAHRRRQGALPGPARPGRPRAAWEDEAFDVHFAFFARTDAATRLRILEGRRMRLQERARGVRGSRWQRTRERRDSYTLALQRHGLDSVEREVRWLERAHRRPSAPAT